MVAEQHCSYELPENVRDKSESLESWHCPNPSFNPYLEDGRLCIFHFPGAKKRAEDLENFDNLLNEKQDAIYCGYVFPPGFDTTLLKLKDANFTGAHFLDHADFAGASLDGHTYFDRVTFDRGASFNEATFTGYVGFKKAIFLDRAEFTGATFCSSLQEEAHIPFGTSTGADFSAAKFKALANFDDATFRTPVDFEYTEFEDDVIFHGASFSKPANAMFLETEFHKEGIFLEVSSQSIFFFANCVFHDLADFQGAVFRGPVTFDRCSFAVEAIFGEFRAQDAVESPIYVRFLNIDMQRVAFRSADLQNVSFIHCYNLDKSEFFSCNWNMAYGRQRVLHDELVMRGQKPIWGSDAGEDIGFDVTNAKEWERVESTYRNIRRNFEDRRDFAGASEFYVGEMEMRRLPKPRIRRQFLSLEALYLNLSNYGENWWKPIVILLLLLGISTLVYAGWPINSDTLGISLMYSLSVFTLLRVSVGEPLHWTGQLMAIVQLVLSPVLITLSVLAIRRKLKR